MMSDEVRSTNGRPSASTPVTTRGTACTMRVLLRFLNSLPGLATVSEAISIVSSTKFPPESFMQTVPVPQCYPFSRDPEVPPGLLPRCVLHGTFRGWFAVRSRQKHPSFLCDPDW